tara:strand:- start:545 stop:751 length:207 start_codon:yes stop_codon:yes gene_type:complete
LPDPLNNTNIHFDRGVELILRGGKKKPKTFQIQFDRLFNFFKREIQINFAFSLNVKKLSSGDKDDSRD